MVTLTMTFAIGVPYKFEGPSPKDCRYQAF